MRVIFMGTPDFAVESLKILHEQNINIVGVVTAPDKPAGRGYKIQQSPVKQYAASHGLKVLQPTNLKSSEFIEELKAIEADLQVVVAFRMLPEIVWNMPLKGTINLHASLLPQYRGAAPINWAVINGEKVTGVTTFYIRQHIDTGAVIKQSSVQIGENDTAGDVHDKLMNRGAQLLLDTVKAIENDKAEVVEQDMMMKGQELKEAPKIHRSTCQINWHTINKEVHNFIRGMSPYPGAWSYIEMGPAQKQKTIKILKSLLNNEYSGTPGEIIIKENKLYIGCISGSIEVKRLQMEGKKRMSAEEFSRGYDLSKAKMI